MSKPCKHEIYSKVGIIIQEKLSVNLLNVLNAEQSGRYEKQVCMCEHCRVLFIPRKEIKFIKDK